MSALVFLRAPRPTHAVAAPRGVPPRCSRRQPQRLCRASSGDSGGAGVPPALTLSEAFAALGLAEGASYEEVLSAKNKLVAKHRDDVDRRMQVEVAYDLIFSSQLRARLTGSLPVSTNVRFADVRQQRRGAGSSKSGGGAAPGGAAGAAQKAKQLLQRLPSGGGVAVAAPPPRTAAIAAGVFGVLAAWTLAQGLLEPTPAAAAADVPGTQLALATAATVYLLRDQKRVGLGKAAALALGGLVAGTLLGSAVQSYLRVDIIPLLGLSSPGALVGEFSIAGLAAVCLFLA